MKFTPLLGCVLIFGLTSRANAQINVENSDFEQGKTNWNLFVPKEGADKRCQFSVETTAAHSGQKAARITSAQSARFGIYSGLTQGLPVQAGARYRLVAWVKAGANYSIERNTPGPVLRATLLDGEKKDVRGGHVFVGLQGVQRGNPDFSSSTPVLSEWTKIEGVIEIPEGTKEMVLFLFSWKSSGTLWVDDISVTEIGTGIASSS